jgi:hypothetical protein
LRIAILRAAPKDQRLMTSKKTGYFLGALAGAGVMAAAVAGAGVRLPQAHAADEPQLIRASTAPIFAPPPARPCPSPTSSTGFRRRWCRST